MFWENLEPQRVPSTIKNSDDLSGLQVFLKQEPGVKPASQRIVWTICPIESQRDSIIRSREQIHGINCDEAARSVGL